MKIVLIGRGRLATNLQRALLEAGHEVVSINSRTLDGLPLTADVFVIAVKDSALSDVICNATKGREAHYVLWCVLPHADFFEGTPGRLCRYSHFPGGKRS